MPAPATAFATALRLEHTTTVDAPSGAVRGLVADVSWWPLLFAATAHAETLAREADGDRLRVTAVDPAGSARSWTTRRTFGADGSIAFAQEAPPAPLASMGGSWTFEDLPGGACRVVLAHHASLTEGSVADHPWLAETVNRTADAQLAAVKAAAELGPRPDAAVVTTSRTVRLPGDVRDAERVLRDAGRLPLLLPRTEGVVSEDAGGDAWVLARPGGPFAVCVAPAPGRVAFKQLAPSAPVTALAGEWTVRPAPGTEGSALLLTLRRRALVPANGAARERIRAVLERGNERLVRRAAAAGLPVAAV